MELSVDVAIAGETARTVVGGDFVEPALVVENCETCGEVWACGRTGCGACKSPPHASADTSAVLSIAPQSSSGPVVSDSAKVKDY